MKKNYKNNYKEIFKQNPLLGIGIGFSIACLILFVFAFFLAVVDEKASEDVLFFFVLFLPLSFIFLLIGVFYEHFRTKKKTRTNFNRKQINTNKSQLITPQSFIKNNFSTIDSISILKKKETETKEMFNNKKRYDCKNNIPNNHIITINEKINQANSLDEKYKFIANYVGTVVSANSLDETDETNLITAIKFIYRRERITFTELKTELNLNDEQCKKLFNLLINLRIIEKSLKEENHILWKVYDGDWEILLPVDMPTNNVDIELEKIDNMSDDGVKFEHYVAKLLLLNGFIKTELTPCSNDYGVDVIATDKIGIKYAVQCKCYHSKLGNSCVQEIVGGKSYYHCQVGVVITNNYFTKNAEELAKVNGIILWDRDKLAELISGTI